MTEVTRDGGDGFLLVLVYSKFHPGEKAWRVVRIANQPQPEIAEEVGTER